MRAEYFLPALALILLACSGTEPGPPADAGDSGPTPSMDAGQLDRDGDGVPDEDDNCPDHANPEQEDSDGDGVGDACDTCPFTPNAGRGDEPGQAECLSLVEQEPNDEASSAMAIPVPAPGHHLELRGVVEGPLGGRQAVDRFTLMVPARTLLHARVTRYPGNFGLEPALSASGGGYTVPREAEGESSLARDLYFAAAGTYEILVTDRRGWFGGAPAGADESGYLLQIAGLTPEYREISGPPTFYDRFIDTYYDTETYELDLEHRGKVFLFDVLGRWANFQSFEIEGRADLILVADFDVDPVLIEENHRFSIALERPRIIMEGGTRGERLLVAVDHPRSWGDDAWARLHVRGHRFLEDGPNETIEAAQEVVLPGGVVGWFEAIPDRDWFKFHVRAGELWACFAGPNPVESVAVPRLEIGPLDASGEFRRLAWAQGGAGGDARADVRAYADGLLYVALNDTSGTSNIGRVNNVRYGFGCVSGPAEFSTVETTSVLSGGFTGCEHCSVVRTYGLLASSRTRLRFNTIYSVDGFEPLLRLLGPGGHGLLAERVRDLDIVVEPAERPYELIVQNNLFPEPVPTGTTSYDIRVVFEPAP